MKISLALAILFVILGIPYSKTAGASESGRNKCLASDIINKCQEHFSHYCQKEGRSTDNIAYKLTTIRNNEYVIFSQGDWIVEGMDNNKIFRDGQVYLVAHGTCKPISWDRFEKKLPKASFLEKENIKKRGCDYLGMVLSKEKFKAEKEKFKISLLETDLVNPDLWIVLFVNYEYIHGAYYLLLDKGDLSLVAYKRDGKKTWDVLSVSEQIKSMK